MTDDVKGEAPDAAAEDAPPQPREPAEPEAGDPSDPPAAPVDLVAQAKAETARVREQFLRTAADFDNFRKRTRKELDDERRRGKESALKDLLPVFDNLERALTGGGTDAKSLLDGIRIVVKQFDTALGKIGVERVKAAGQPFDPNLHEAIQQMDSAEHPAGVVISEVQAGYRLGDYLMRAAMVIVSRGPGKAEPSAPAADAEPSADPAPEA